MADFALFIFYPWNNIRRVQDRASKLLELRARGQDGLLEPTESGRMQDLQSGVLKMSLEGLTGWSFHVSLWDRQTHKGIGTASQDLCHQPDIRCQQMVGRLKINQPEEVSCGQLL